MKTDKFEFTIGVTEGYFHNNENANMNLIHLVDKCSREVEEATGIYVSFNIIPTITIYKTEWGCPIDGEKTYTLSAVRNPKFNDDKEKWKDSCIDVMLKLKNELKQSTVISEFSEIHIRYWISK